MSQQSNSDPLPYVQVDRAVKPRAALLAGALGVSNQHAVGSLVEWWDLCGDPRELERIVEATPPGDEPAVLLSPGDAQLRFRLASGKDVDPVELVHLGLLEPRGEQFRVRGMSRYFEPIRKRIKARASASAAGKASAESRRKATGTAQPRSGDRSESGSATGSGAVRESFERPPNASRTPPNPSGQRSAVSGLLEEEDQPQPKGPLIFEPPTTDPSTWNHADFFRWAQASRQALGLLGEKWPRKSLSHWWSTALGTPGVTVGRLQQAFRNFSLDEHWGSPARKPAAPFEGFMSVWSAHVPPGEVQSTPVDPVWAQVRPLVLERFGAQPGGANGAFVAQQLQLLSWAGEWGAFVGTAADPLFAEWVRGHFGGPLRELGVTIVGPAVQAEAGAA